MMGALLGFAYTILRWLLLVCGIFLMWNISENLRSVSDEATKAVLSDMFILIILVVAIMGSGDKYE